MIFTRDKAFYKNLIALAIPISLQYLITYGVNLADNLMIGQLGDTAVSGVYMGSQFQTFIQMFSAGIEGAILILSAQYWGKKDISSIKKIIAVGIKFAIGFGALFTILAVSMPDIIIRIFTSDNDVIESGAVYLRIVGFSYIFFCISQVFVSAMRSVENAKIGLYLSLLALILNVGLNYVLIYGILFIPPMGVAGAAIATLISRIIEAAAAVLYVRFKDKKLKLRLSELLQTDKEYLKDFIRYGLPIIGGQIVWSCNMMANSMILGRYGAEVITATSIAMNLHNLVYVWMNGLSSAVGIITGKTVGAGKYEKMKEYARTVQMIFLFVGIISGGIVYLLRDPFISLYTVSEGALGYARQFINVISVTIIGTCYQAACLFGLVKSGGDISFVFKNDTIFVFLVVLPLSITAKLLGADPWVVFALLKCDQILKCFVAVVKINRFNWMKNLTRNEDSLSSNKQEMAEISK
jgi:putative MATE family efflux protein